MVKTEWVKAEEYEHVVLSEQTPEELLNDYNQSSRAISLAEQGFLDEAWKDGDPDRDVTPLKEEFLTNVKKGMAEIEAELARRGYGVKAV